MSKSDRLLKKPLRKLCDPSLVVTVGIAIGTRSPARLRRGLPPLRGMSLVVLSLVASAVAGPLSTGGLAKQQNTISVSADSDT
jgi:hypothetical protein